jgi:hypothetical protein
VRNWGRQLINKFGLIVLPMPYLPMAIEHECSHCGGRFFPKPRAYEKPVCGRCGYDLTGNISGACPECGWHLPQELRDRLEQSKTSP